MTQVRALTVPLHILVGVCGMDKEVLSTCFDVISEMVTALSFLRHSALVASVNTIGAGAPFHRPVCSLLALCRQIESCRRYPNKQTHDHGQGCLCNQDYQIATESFRDTECYIIYLTSPTMLPNWTLLSKYWKNQHLRNRKLQLILLRQEEEDINSSVSAIVEIAERIATLSSISIVQAENDVIDLRRIMKPWLRRFQEYIPTRISFGSSTKLLNLVLRSNMCFYCEESRALMHVGLANLTGLHFVPLETIDGNFVLGYPLNAEATQNPSNNQFECKVLFSMLNLQQLALMLVCTAPNKQKEYFAMVPSSSSFSSHWCFTLFRILSIDQIALTSNLESSEPILGDVSTTDITSWTLAAPTQSFNPYNYASEYRAEVGNPLQQQLPKQTRQLL